jgi:hypothetical protein
MASSAISAFWMGLVVITELGPTKTWMAGSKPGHDEREVGLNQPSGIPEAVACGIERPRRTESRAFAEDDGCGAAP